MAKHILLVAKPHTQLVAGLCRFLAIWAQPCSLPGKRHTSIQKKSVALLRTTCSHFTIDGLMVNLFSRKLFVKATKCVYHCSLSTLFQLYAQTTEAQARNPGRTEPIAYAFASGALAQAMDFRIDAF